MYEYKYHMLTHTQYDYPTLPPTLRSEGNNSCHLHFLSFSLSYVIKELL